VGKANITRLPTRRKPQGIELGLELGLDSPVYKTNITRLPAQRKTQGIGLGLGLGLGLEIRVRKGLVSGKGLGSGFRLENIIRLPPQNKSKL
jgi:hypothetical protein